MLKELKILIIEDNKGDIFLVQEMLAKSISDNYKIAVALTLEKGMKAMKEESFDAVLLDLNLPDSEGGLDSLHKILELNTGNPIIVITSEEDMQLGIEAVKLGAQDYIQKDELNPYIISRAVHYSIERNNLMREIATLKKENAKFSN